MVVRRRLIGLTIAGSLLLGACSSSGREAMPKISDPTTPTETALAWFAAIDAQDQKATDALMTSSSDWDWTNPAPKNAFTNVRCHPEGQSTGAGASVHCTFTEAPGDWSGNPDTWWTIYMQKSGGKWLVYDHGQP